MSDYFGDYDVYDVCTTTVRRAAKQHRCCECRRTIEKGERYRDRKALADGQWAQYRTCTHCRAVAQALIYWTGWDELPDCILGDLVEGCSGDIDAPRHRRLARWLAHGVRSGWATPSGGLRPLARVRRVVAWLSDYTNQPRR